MNRREALKTATGLTLVALGRDTAIGGRAAATPLTFEEYVGHDAVGLAKLVREERVSPEELLETAIACLEAVNGDLNAVVGKTKNQREELYDLARKSIDHLPDGPFRGVPFAVKDLGFLMAGVESAAGSVLFQDFVPPEDSLPISRLRAAGLVFFARTTTPEFGNLTVTQSTATGITSNPWDIDRTPGGSSGGSAAVVAAGVVPMAAGGDGGGSIRVPAACCGLFGLKPSRERIPIGHRILTVHAITRTVRDSAALLDSTKGPTAGNTVIPPHGDVSFERQVAIPPGKLRIASVSQVPLMDDPLHPSCVQGLKEAAELCTNLGHSVEDKTEEYAKVLDWYQLFESLITYLMPEYFLLIDSRLKELKRELLDHDLEPANRTWFERAKSYSGVDVWRAKQHIDAAAVKVATFMKDYDVILTPTTAKPPIKHNVMTLQNEDTAEYLKQYRNFTPFTFIANCTGQPAMSVPLYWTDDTKPLPIGMQFIGRFGDEATLFRLAGELERERPWANMRPRIHVT